MLKCKIIVPLDIIFIETFRGEFLVEPKMVAKRAAGF